MKAIFGENTNGIIQVEALFGGKNGYLAPYGELKRTETPDGDMVWTLFFEDEQIDPVDYFDSLEETKQQISDEVVSEFDDDDGSTMVTMEWAYHLGEKDEIQRTYIFDKKVLIGVLVEHFGISDPDSFLSCEYTDEDTSMVLDYFESNGIHVPYANN